MLDQSAFVNADNNENVTPRPGELVSKRVFDMTVAVVAIVAMAPLFVIVAILILVDDGRPIFFQQKRSGLNGEPFMIWKFRTMKKNASDNAQAVMNDNRITRIGVFLRVSCVDELPQLFNVLVGDMSIIGPRPHPVWLDNRFHSEIDGYRQRWVVRPGMTGLAQVNDARGETKTMEDMAQRIMYDLDYIQQISLRRDMEILMKTVVVVFRSLKFRSLKAS